MKTNFTITLKGSKGTRMKVIFPMSMKVSFSLSERLLKTGESFSIASNSGPVPAAAKMIAKCQSLSEVNYFANLYSKLSDHVKETFYDAIESGITESENVKDLINATQNVFYGYYRVLNVEEQTPETVCRFHFDIEEKQNPNFKADESKKEHFSFMGCALMALEKGRFINKNYIGRTGIDLITVYGGDERTIPIQYKVPYKLS